ncbi:MAG: hypothetical protein K6G87_16590 [Butyrivibrio sp.]|uniref:hypothetical protein n=1 Tax=Butyrivibrio sp. TaxID=28121 RepID=UPI0025E40B33|nr:hypothetical protein [Butyrivibrio sp.]MCR5772842.1 hypothetical protein [Butyrivibrio sp.]
MESSNLFCVVSTYHVLFAIEYKQKYHQNDYSVLMVPNTIFTPLPQITKLKRIFDDVIIYPYFFPKEVLKEVKEESAKYFDELFMTNSINIKDFNTIYACNPTEYFGLFLSSNNIPFVFIEDAAGVLSNQDTLKHIHEKQNSLRKELCNEYGLYDASCSCVTRKIGNKDAQTNKDIEMEHFDVAKEYEGLPEDIKSLVREVFCVPDSIEASGEVLFLTEHFANLNLMSLDEQILIYQTVFDYFFQDKQITLKPHPNDLLFYEELFPNFDIIHEKFPSELLPNVFKRKPEIVGTITSTGINNIKTAFQQCFYAGYEFRSNYMFIDRYYVILKILLRITNMDRLKLVGVDSQMIDMFLKFSDVDETVANGPNVTIVDFLNNETDAFDSIIELVKNASDDEVIAFVNSREDFAFYDYDRKYDWNYIIPVGIEKKQTREQDFYSDTDESDVYFYTRSKSARKIIEEFAMEKDLKYTGMEISVEQKNEYETRIKTLEGILEATEKRLLYYIEKDKEKNKQ